jgi:hypothetical protein
MDVPEDVCSGSKKTTQTSYKLQKQAMQKKLSNLLIMQTGKKVREDIAVVQIV